MRLLPILLAVLLLSTCSKELVRVGTVIALPIDEPVRAVRGYSDIIVLAGGAAKGTGFCLAFDAGSQSASVLSQGLVGPIYQLDRFNDQRFVCLTDTARLFWSDDLESFGQLWYQAGNFVPLLNQQPIWDIAIAPDSKVHTCGGGELRFGLLQRNVDSLETWRNSIVNNELRTICFPTANVGYTGGFGAILKTEDAGETWNPLAIEGLFVTGMAFADQFTGVVCTYDGEVLCTTNGGADWDSVLKRKDRTGVQVFYQLEQLSDGSFAVLGDGELWRSSDGKDWRRTHFTDAFEGRCFGELTDGRLLIGGTGEVLLLD